MVNENDNHIMFDTLEPWPYATLQEILQRLEIADEKVFLGVHENLQPMLHDVLRVQSLEKTYEIGSQLVYLQSKLIVNADVKYLNNTIS